RRCWQKNGRPAAAEAGGRSDARGSSGHRATRLRADESGARNVSLLRTATGGRTAANTITRAGRATTPLRVSAVAGAAGAGRLAGQPQEDLPAVCGGEAVVAS